MKLIITPFAILFLAACHQPNSQVSYTDSVASSMIDTTTPAVSYVSDNTVLSSWDYSETKDEMTGTMNYFANKDANEELFLKSPYNGGILPMLQVEYGRKELSVVLRLKKGQFMDNYDDRRRIRIKFDDGQSFLNNYSNPTDYSTNLIFIDNERSFVNKLKKAKKLIIEVELYNNGVQTIHFDVDGFKWNH